MVSWGYLCLQLASLVMLPLQIIIRDRAVETIKATFLGMTVCGSSWKYNGLFVRDRAIFAWPWYDNPQTKQKWQMNRNRVIWLVYQTDANACGFWLVKPMHRLKKFMPGNFLEIPRYFALTSYCNRIGQLNNVFSILGFSLAGRKRGHVLFFKFKRKSL